MAFCRGDQMIRLALCVCALALGGCSTSLQREVLYAPVFDASTHTLWLVEKNTQVASDDELRVTLCHREASPACVRVRPMDMRDGDDYRRWLETIPASVRRLATLRPTPWSLPSAPQQAQPAAPAPTPVSPPTE
jgi:hypothetical protein